MASKGNGRGLPATCSGPKPSDSLLGSLESRAAARSMLDGLAGKDCICFPPDELPDLELKAEIEAARVIPCPLHGERFSKLVPAIYRAPRSVRPSPTRELVGVALAAISQGPESIFPT